MTRAITLVEILSRSKVCTRRYSPAKLRDSHPWLPLGSPGTKSHSDATLAEWCRVYCMGEGGGFPRVRAVVSLVSPKLPVACPSIKGVLEGELTNLLIGLMQVRVSN